VDRTLPYPSRVSGDLDIMQASAQPNDEREAAGADAASRPWKTWLGRFALVVVPPLLALGSAECLCRACGWGFPTSFLVPDAVDGREVWRANEFYGYRFFQPLMARSPAPIQIDRVKPAGVTRVAVLGESAAMGDPLIEFGLARALEKVLNSPGEPRRYEVINAAVTAVSSPIIVDIAGDLARADVDVFVVYMGNNEVIGPYGPGTVFTRSRIGAWLAPWLVRWSRTRLASAAQWWRSAASPGSAWDGMAMFSDSRLTAGDPRLAAVYGSFEHNLERIVAIADKRGIETILCTVAVNLRDCPPFASTRARPLDAADEEVWRRALVEGRKALDGEDMTSATTAFDAALRIDPDHAQLNYLAAVAAERSGDADEAARRYRRARDLDTLRVRTDGRLNQAIRSVASRDGLTLVDGDEVFGTAPGAESFVDHVHFTVAGVARLANAVARVIDASATVVDSDTLAERLGHDEWSEAKLATIMLERMEHPPFRDQDGNADRVARWLTERRAAGAVPAADAGQILAALERHRADYPWDDEYAVQALHHLAGVGAWSHAADVADDVRAELHGASAVGGLVALVYARAGRPDDAAGVLAATGPPYGYFLADAAFQLLPALEGMGAPDTARAVAEALLARVARFPGRPAIAGWCAEAEGRTADQRGR